MTGTAKKQSLHHDRKTKSGLSSLKKKLSIPRIYKRLASKLSVHGRHIRSLTSTWNVADLQSLVSQYEVTSMLKELSDAAETSHGCVWSITDDLMKIQKENYLCDLTLSLESEENDHSPDVTTSSIQVHSVLFSKRTSVVLHQNKTSLRNTATTPSSTQNENDEVVVIAEPHSFFEKLPFHIDYKYTKAVKKLKLFSKDRIPKTFLETLLSYLYGETCANICSMERGGMQDQTSALSQPARLTEDCVLNQGVHHSVNVASISSLHYKSVQSPIEQPSKVFSSTSSTPDNDSHNSKNERKFAEEFRNDMKDLLLSANVTGDVKLVFSVSTLLSVLSSHLRSRQPGLCCHCHSFILAARSRFFRKTIQRRKERTSSNVVDCSPFMTIEIDWKVFSPRYFFVVLYAMYTDEIDLQRITKTVPVISHRSSMESLSIDVKDLMELIFIGRFLEFPALIQGCENALLERLNVSNFTEMLHWSSQPHGSRWLQRQIVSHARENFQQLLANGVLFSLSALEMSEIISSDYVNAPELDILRAVLKWGEHELFRRIKMRDKSHHDTTHVRLSSSKRRDLIMTNNGEDLHNITAPLLAHVRLCHVLPSSHEILASALKLGAVGCPPDHYFDWRDRSSLLDVDDSSVFWIYNKASSSFSPPRLFLPYVSEAKTMLQERLCQDVEENLNLKAVRKPALLSASVVPDALYMVNQLQASSRPPSTHVSSTCEKCLHSRINVISLATTRLKFIDNRFPVPSPELASKLLARERTLRQEQWIRKILQACHVASVTAQHCAFSSTRNSNADSNGKLQSGGLCNLCRAESYIRLLVVREHNLPDVAVDLLRRPNLYYDPDELFPVSTDAVKTQIVVKSAMSESSSKTTAPKRFQKLFQKRSAAVRKRSAPVARVDRSWKEEVTSTNGSSSDLSLSDDSGSEWPFPYRDFSIRDRNQPGSAFWDSDTSIKTPPLRCAVPDVAASADSTLKTQCSRLSCSSSSDSCSSVPCRLVAESQPQTNEISNESNAFYRSNNDESSSTFSGRTSTSSYAHYLSMRRNSRRNRSITFAASACEKTSSLQRSDLSQGDAGVTNNTIPQTNSNSNTVIFHTPLVTRTSLTSAVTATERCSSQNNNLFTMLSTSGSVRRPKNRKFSI